MTINDLRVRAKTQKRRLPDRNAISNAMEELRAVGLVKSEKIGSEIMAYYLDPERVAEMTGRAK